MTGRSEPAAPNRDILIVDDEPENLLAFKVALGDLEPRVETASSGADALGKLLNHDFAVIVLDIKMAGLDGFETARLIRARKKTRLIPIIFVTAFNQDPRDLELGYQLGAVDFLYKPVVPAILRAKVGVFVELRDRNRQILEQADRLRELERREAEHRLREERRRWEEEALRKRNEELAAADRKKDEFLAVLAHELRNPLTPLVTGLALLKNDSLDPESIDRVRISMERQVAHLVRLVDDLLDVARISQGKINLAIKPIDLVSVVEQSIDACRAHVERAGHQLHVEKSAVPVPVNGDEVRLAQVVSNLLTNSARYTDAGGRIGVKVGVEGGRAIVVVKDNGRGIAPEHLDRIFDMFMQEHRNGEGLGLGLTLVKTLVEMHGGEVTAKSDGPGRGSEFIVSLPVAEESIRERERIAPASRAPAKRRRIVLVEDNTDVRNMVRLLLEQWGHQVFVAANGTTGFELVMEYRPDVAILDLSLPGMDGFTLAERITQRLGDDRPLLIAVSGLAASRDRERTSASGFDYHFSKPADPEILQKLLDGDPKQ